MIQLKFYVPKILLYTKEKVTKKHWYKYPVLMVLYVFQ